jgi:hypothetical protein
MPALSGTRSEMPALEQTRRVLGAALLSCFLVLAATTPAVADQAGGPAAQQGIDGLVPAPPIQHGNQQTLAERFPASAYAPFHVDLGGALGQAFLNPVEESENILVNVWASELAMVLLIIAVLTSRLLEWTFSLDVVTGAGTPLTQVVQALANQVYAPLIGAALVLVGIWLTWHLLLRRRTMLGLQGGAWAIVAVVAAGAYFAAPVQLMSGLNSFTADISRSVLGAVGGADPRMVGRGGDPSFSQGDPGDAELRVFVDRYWRTFVFTPWSVAALGDVQDGQRYGEELLAKQAGRPSNFDSDFRNAPQSAQDWYAGKQGGQRLAIVSMALVVIILASILFLLIAGAVVVAQLAFLLLLMVAPLFLLAGIQPGMGRRLLIRWGELAAGALLLRVLSSCFLAVLVVLSGIVTDVGSAAGWGVAAGLQLALMVAAIVYRKPFLRVFGQVASPRLGPAMSHVSHSRPAEMLHGYLDRRAGRLRRAGSSSTRAAIGARAATAAAGGPAGVALTVLEAGKMGVRAPAHATRRLQDAVAPFLLDGRSGAPPRPRFVRTGHRPAPSGSDSGRSRSRATPPRTGGKQPPPPTPPEGHTYTNHRTGSSVTVSSSKILLPNGWSRVRRP